MSMMQDRFTMVVPLRAGTPRGAKIRSIQLYPFDHSGVPTVWQTSYRSIGPP